MLQNECLVHVTGARIFAQLLILAAILRSIVYYMKRASDACGIGEEADKEDRVSNETKLRMSRRR